MNENVTICTALSFTTEGNQDMPDIISQAYDPAPTLVKLQLTRLFRPTPDAPAALSKNGDVGTIEVLPLASVRCNRSDPGKQVVHAIICTGVNLFPRPLGLNDEGKYVESKANLKRGSEIDFYIDESADIGYIIDCDGVALAIPDDMPVCSGKPPIPLFCQGQIDETALAAKHNPKGKADHA